jgi:hypothetical protein
MERTRAVEDYEHIRKRLEELRREAENWRPTSDGAGALLRGRARW